MDQVVAQAAAGSIDAIAILYQDLYPRLRRYAEHKVPGDGDDIASDAWLALAPKLASIEGGMAGVRKLAFTIARRRIIDLRRRRGFRRTDPTGSVHVLDRSSDAHQGPEALVSDRIDAQLAIDRLTEHLPEAAAEILVLRVVGGLSAEEVGTIVGKSPGAIRVTQHRAVSRLASLWDRGEVTQ